MLHQYSETTSFAALCAAPESESASFGIGAGYNFNPLMALPVLYLSTWIRGKEELANQISVHHGEKTDSILQNDQLIQEAFNHASETSIKVVDL